MANNTFENIAAQIAAGTITAKEIQQYQCTSLTTAERQALLISLAATLVADGTGTELATLQTGIQVGAGDIVVPAFLSGRCQFVDTDGTATDALDGTHQYATDTTGAQYPEESSMVWEATDGKHFNNRTITVPDGVTVLYTFILKA